MMPTTYSHSSMVRIMKTWYRWAGMHPDRLIESDGSDEEAHVVVGENQDWGGIGGSSSKKREIEETIEAERKKLGSSATFTSNEDCATMIEDGRIH